jgi:hypothetical protein
LRHPARGDTRQRARSARDPAAPNFTRREDFVIRRSIRSTCLLLGITLLVSCTDDRGPTGPTSVTSISRQISDGARGGQLDFFWLPPTVETSPTFTGPFDANALDQLVVEVCQLSAGACSGPPIERMTSEGTPVPARIRLDADGEYYHVTWMSGRSHAEAGAFYRIRVLRNGSELGFLDVQVVQNTPALASVNTSLYTGLVKGQQLEIRFRIQLPTARTTVKVNEVESSGGVPGDWIELYNTNAAAVSLAGYIIKDNDDTHVYTFPAGTTIPGNGFFVVEEAALGFGLGSADAARLFTPDGTTIVDSYSWGAHAVNTYGRCPDGSGAFRQTTAVTKGLPNDCSVIVRINEVESSGGTPGDWAELYNPTPVDEDIGEYVFKDNDDTHVYTIPAGTTIPAGGYFVLEEAAFGFGLGSADAARLFKPGGVTIADSYDWTSHAATTYGRCPNGTGAFTTTAASTKGQANACSGGGQTGLPWPGDPDVQTVDGTSVFGGNLSGLTYEGSGSATPGVLWAARNGPGTLFRLVWNGTIWTPDAANDWGTGKALKYMDGTGNPDAEGVTFASGGSTAGMYVSTERNNDANAISRNSILRFDPNAAGTTLTATNEWNLTSDLPVVGANVGIEAVTWIPDAFLTASGFVDESKSKAYAPADYPNHGDGLFFVGVEANGIVYAYALNHANNTFTRIATITTGLAGVMGLEFDRELHNLWAVCDDGCGGRSVVLQIATIDQPTPGRFAVTRLFERPTGMPNLNNEGFAIATQAECVSNRKAAFWADDGETGGHAIRRGTVSCTPF